MARYLSVLGINSAKLDLHLMADGYSHDGCIAEAFASLRPR
jgi:hypothetical protein